MNRSWDTRMHYLLGISVIKSMIISLYRSVPSRLCAPFAAGFVRLGVVLSLLCSSLLVLQHLFLVLAAFLAIIG
ncbi:uncharacterized protein K460DRAFT_61122 [Cucurbitaria berberidis CBS 394.84]|uniref:Uncharacterized protein n=1 Tax=Cucurbitaria berberidis CBS 394.84 TaxID=1168544 RepID=A0A9P4GLW4_9PLEO|nr:uncharacterized protein K460DRAFT_61122 [Cucurbitaria berberidis CBS 394.84]KAF1847584.1 hypothetical protein K460DRAFT_61122 [Cucurbitaria berberidis CBS 394.84]